MGYQIDQSGKIEQTNKNSILCISNSNWNAVLIPAKVKRQLQEVFRRNGQVRNFIYLTFAAGLTILLEQQKRIQHVTVDREYYGHESTISKIVAEMSQKKLPQVRWALIGKRAMAHNRAYAVGLGKLEAQKIKKTEVGKRLKDA